MPIVSHKLEVGTTQTDGRVSYVFRMYDQDGTEHGPQLALLPADFDIPAWVAMKIAEKDVQLAEDEFRALVGL